MTLRRKCNLTNNCKIIIEGVTGPKPHPHSWSYLIKDKRQCFHCNISQFKDFDGWHDNFAYNEQKGLLLK